MTGANTVPLGGIRKIPVKKSPSSTVAPSFSRWNCPDCSFVNFERNTGIVIYKIAFCWIKTGFERNTKIDNWPLKVKVDFISLDLTLKFLLTLYPSLPQPYLAEK